jgi:glycosyltransferase involved in cell wall biosynthesis
MTKRAIVCVSNDLSTDQRVHKTCLTLQKCGYTVTEIGRLLPNSIDLERPYSTLRKKLIFNCGPLFYAELNIRFFFYLLFKKVDLIFANDLDTLLACYLASKLRNNRLIYDSHEYFTETPELVSRPNIQKVWKSIEYLILPHLTNIITVNESIAKIYSSNYDIDVKVVRNIPLYKQAQTKKSLELNNVSQYKNIIIYQGALNKGRCLENVLIAMTMVADGHLIIIGDGDLTIDLKKLSYELNITDRVSFIGKIDGTTLHQYTRLAKIGICLLENNGLNYYYSLPNRIFDYLYAGVPVLASSFPEIKNIVEQFKTGVLIKNNSPELIAQHINQLLNDGFDTSHFQSIYTTLSWENEEKVLMEIIQKSEQK